MTVEAALVVPAAIFGTVLIIYLSFMVYGRCILTQDVYILGFRASILYEKQGFANPDDYVIAHADEVTGSRYFGSNKPDITATMSGKDIRVEGKTTTHHNALGGYFSGLPSIWSSKASARVRMLRPATTLRRMKRAKDLATGFIR